LASEQINARPSDYWLLVMDIARRFNLKRVLACGSSMGAVDAASSDEPKEQDGPNLDVASPRVLYPCMQCADPFFLGAGICHVNGAQRAVVEMSRDYCDVAEVRQLKRLSKPLMLLHATLPNLKGPQPAGALNVEEGVLYMDDEAADVKKKINRAFCPERECAGNPCIEVSEQLVFALGLSLDVKRSEANGGDKYVHPLHSLVLLWSQSIVVSISGCIRRALRCARTSAAARCILAT
jgi:tyrosyl-tRNA synthetase